MNVVHVNQAHTHYIGRPSIFGNPFMINPQNTREQVIEQFETYARRNSVLLTAIRQLPADAVLGCYCAPHACHGDVIVDIWKELHA
jgi:hypothetical protein